MRVLDELEKLARSPTVPILLEGESGTGKTRIARCVHESSARAGGPFHAVNMGGLDDALAGSELFGHVSGAFTDARQARAGLFASSLGGSLFLDEIGKTSLSVQRKLLHVIEGAEMRPIGSDRAIRIDVRVIAASNRHLEDLAHEGAFLPDLYARLQVFCVRLPSLRERRADIPVLVDDAVDAYRVACGYGHRPDVAPTLMKALIEAPWPNNLRQLDATVHRIMIEAQGALELRLDHCVGVARSGDFLMDWGLRTGASWNIGGRGGFVAGMQKREAASAMLGGLAAGRVFDVAQSAVTATTGPTPSPLAALASALPGVASVSAVRDSRKACFGP